MMGWIKRMLTMRRSRILRSVEEQRKAAEKVDLTRSHVQILTRNLEGLVDRIEHRVKAEV